MKKTYLKKFEHLTGNKIFDINRRLKGVEQIPFTEEEKAEIKINMLKREYIEPKTTTATDREKMTIRVNTDQHQTILKKYQNGTIVITECKNCHNLIHNNIVSYFVKW